MSDIHKHPSAFLASAKTWKQQQGFFTTYNIYIKDKHKQAFLLLNCCFDLLLKENKFKEKCIIIIQNSSPLV